MIFWYHNCLKNNFPDQKNTNMLHSVIRFSFQTLLGYFFFYKPNTTTAKCIDVCLSAYIFNHRNFSEILWGSNVATLSDTAVNESVTVLSFAKKSCWKSRPLRHYVNAGWSVSSTHGLKMLLLK